MQLTENKRGGGGVTGLRRKIHLRGRGAAGFHMPAWLQDPSLITMETNYSGVEAPSSLSGELE